MPPVTRCRAGLYRDNARLLVQHQLNKPGARYRPVENNDAIGPDAANLKTVLGKIDRQ